MSNKYRQAIANAMMGKCIPYKRETKAVLNEMLDMVTIKCGYWRHLTESEITGWNPNLAGYDPVGGYVCSIVGKNQCLTVMIYMFYLRIVPIVELICEVIIHNDLERILL